MKKVIDYLICTGSEACVLGEHVSAQVEQGWQPYGDPFADGDDVCQALVKYEEEFRFKDE